MSVYTEVTRDELITFLADYNVGKLVSYRGISEGIENTNYFVTTEQGEFVLTLFEQYAFDELDYFLEVMTFFFQQNILSASPQADNNGHYLKRLKAKPAALVHRLAGQGVMNTASLRQCEQMGEALGKMHQVAKQFPLNRANARDADWRQNIGQQLLTKLDAEQADILQQELAFQADYADLNLPAAVIHADLFRDNALFDGDQLTGIIDFYYACDDYLLYDLAVAINDWCVDERGLPSQERYQAFMSHYQQQRPVTELEQQHWNKVLRAAALRFWLSRLQDKLFPKAGELTHIKNPDAFLQILQWHRQDQRNFNEMMS